MAPNETRTPGPDAPGQVVRGRPRFIDVRSTKSPDGSREIEVTLEWPGGRRSSGEGESVGLPEAEDRAAAQATLAAIGSGPLPDPALRLRGTKAIRAFDHLVIVVAVDRDVDGGTTPLIGSVCAPKSDRVRGAVLATLNAVNRVIEGEVPPNR